MISCLAPRSRRPGRSRWYAAGLALAAAVPLRVGAQAPTVSVSAVIRTTGEAATTIKAFRISRTGATLLPLAVNLAVQGSATAGADYVALPPLIVIPIDSAAVSLPVSILADTLSESDESIVLQIQGGTGYVAQNGAADARTLTILDDDVRLTVTAPDSVAMEPGGDTGLLVIGRAGAPSATISYQLALQGTASNGTDYRTIALSRTLGPGQLLDSIAVVPLSDNDVEPTETVLASIASAGGLPAGAHVAFGPGATVRILDARVIVAASPASVPEVDGNVATFILTRTGDLGAGATVGVALSGTATNGADYQAVPSPSSVSFAPHAATATFALKILGDTAPEGAETIVLSLLPSPRLAAGVPNSATVVIDEAADAVVAALSLSPASVVGGHVVVGTVTLNGAAPAGGRLITLSGPPSGVKLPASVTVPAGASSATFDIGPGPVAATAQFQIAAAAPAGNPVSSPLTVRPPALATLTFNRPAVTPQAAADSASLVGTVTLDGPAPGGGAQVDLISSLSGTATVPASVTVPAGALTATVAVTVTPVASPVVVTLTARRDAGSVAQPVVVSSPVVQSVRFAPASLAGRLDPGSNTQGTVVLSGPAGAKGLPISLSSDNPRLAFAAASFLVPGGLTSGSFAARALPVATPTTVAVTTDRGGQGLVTIVPPTPVALTLGATSVVAGTGTSGRVSLNGHAPAGGLSLPLAGSGAGAAFCNPGGVASIAALSIPGDSLGAPVSVCTSNVLSPQNVTLSAGPAPGAASQTLQVLPRTLAVSAMDLMRADLIGTASDQNLTAANRTTLTVLLAEPAPTPGYLVPVASSPALLRWGSAAAGFAPAPIQVFVPTGSTHGVVELRAQPVASDVTVSLDAGPGGPHRDLLVRAPSPVSLAFFGPAGEARTSAPSRGTLSGTVTLDGPAPSGGVTLAVSVSNASVSVPGTVQVNSGQSVATVPLTVAPTVVDTGVTLTFTRGSSSASAHLNITGVVGLESIVLSPAVVVGGSRATATVTLNAPARAGGAAVLFSGGTPATAVLVSVPQPLSVPQGQTTLSFFITTRIAAGSGNIPVPFTVTVGDQSRSAGLGITPIAVSAVTFNPPGVAAGGTTTGTVLISPAAPEGGAVIGLTASSSLASVPSVVLVPAGSTSATFVLTAGPASATTSVNVRAVLAAAFGQSEATGALTVTAAPSSPSFDAEARDWSYLQPRSRRR